MDINKEKMRKHWILQQENYLALVENFLAE
jgi:hypothetical protein